MKTLLVIGGLALAYYWLMKRGTFTPAPREMQPGWFKDMPVKHWYDSILQDTGHGGDNAHVVK